MRTTCVACVVLCLAVTSAPSRKIVGRAKRSLQESLQCTQEQTERYRRFFFRGLLSVFVIVAVALFLSTRHYMAHWSDTITLFERSLPRFWNVNFAEVLNQELKKANRETEREQLLSEAVIKCPSVDLLLDYAYMLIKKAAEGDASGRPLYTLARVYAEQALQIDPKSDRAIKFMEAFNKGRKAK